MLGIVKRIAITGTALVAFVVIFELLTGHEIHKQAFFLWGAISALLAAVGFRVVGYDPDEDWVKVRLKQGLVLLFSLPPLVIIPLAVKQNTLSALFGALLGNLVYFVVLLFYFYLSTRTRRHA